MSETAPQFVGDEEPESSLEGSTAQDPYEVAASEEQAEEIRQLITQLTPRQRQVLELLYGLNGQQEHTIQEVRALLGLSAERVRNIRRSAIYKLDRLPKGRESLTDDL